MRYADLKPGMVIRIPARRAITEQEIVDFARRYDPQWFHVDAAKAAGSRWRGLIASGWMTCAITMELVVAHVLDGSESIGGPGLEYLKWPNPLRPGDEVTLRIEVLESKISRSGRFGVVRWRWLLTKPPGVELLDLVSTNLFEIHSQRACTP